MPSNNDRTIFNKDFFKEGSKLNLEFYSDFWMVYVKKREKSVSKSFSRKELVANFGWLKKFADHQNPFWNLSLCQRHTLLKV